MQITGKHIQVTIVVTGSTIILRMGIQTILRVERTEKFLIYTPTCDKDTLVANEVRKDCQINLLGDYKAV